MNLLNKNPKKKKNTDYKWVIKVTLTAFLISFCFSTLSETVIPNVNLVVGIILMLLFIFIGIIFDMVGVSITAASLEPFHSMAAKKVRGAKLAIHLIKNAEKMSSFCNDVIGDICGIISGAVGITVALSIADYFKINSLIITLFITALIASLTIGGKALEKGYAVNKSNNIVFRFAKVLSIFCKEK